MDISPPDPGVTGGYKFTLGSLPIIVEESVEDLGRWESRAGEGVNTNTYQQHGTDGEVGWYNIAQIKTYSK